MESEEIKMPDGRYLIYYTFEDEAETAEAVENKHRAEPQTTAQKEEGGDV